MAIFSALNTKIENSGYLSAIGDFGLAPCRALWNGKTVTVIGDDVTEKDSKMMHKALAVVLIIPGLFLAIFKLAAYLIFSDVRMKHELVRSFVSKPEVSSLNQPLKDLSASKNIMQLNSVSEDLGQNPKALFLGNGQFSFDEQMFMETEFGHLIV